MSLQEEIAKYREQYNKALYDLVYADTKDADYAKKYVDEHPARNDESLV